MKGLLALILFATATASAAPKQPNILFILADDLGWMDLACQGNPHLSTPHLDQFAAENVRFTDAYAPSPVCSPTRAAILTGLSPLCAISFNLRLVIVAIPHPCGGRSGQKG